MSLSGILIGILLGTFFVRLKFFKLGRVMQGSGVILFFLIGSGLLPNILLQSLQEPYVKIPVISWKAHNVILLLGGGNVQVSQSVDPEVSFFAQARVNKTVSLYYACKKEQPYCKIMVSGGDPQHYGKAEAVVYSKMLQDLGVHSQDIILEDQSINTWQNAKLTQNKLKELSIQNIENIVMVSSGIHLKRSALCFSHFGMNVVPVRGDYFISIWSFWPLAYNFTMTDFSLHEYLGMLRYYIYNQWGWHA